MISRTTYNQSAFRKIIRKLFSGFLCIPIVLAAVVAIVFWGMYFQNTFNVQTKIYNRQDVVFSEYAINIIKNKMIHAGFTENDIANMPDSEIINYANLKSINKDEYAFENDGGKCTITYYSTALSDPQGTVRIAVLYHWDVSPKHAFADVIGVGFNSKNLAVYSDNYQDITSYNLYDKKNENNEVITYSAEDVKRGFNNIQYYKRYEVYKDAGITNQRGYLAYNLRFIDCSEKNITNTIPFYIHQMSFLTLNNTPEDKFSSGTYSEDIKYDFISSYFVTEITNNP